MPVINSLVLDHFYISLSEKDFDKYSAFMKCLGGTHMNIKSGNDGWEGCYLLSRTRDYLEVLKERRKGGLGIALSSVNSHLVDTERILIEHEDLDWKKGLRLRQNKDPWFRWYSLEDYEALTDNEFNVWVMDYVKTHIEYKQKPAPKYIDEFVCLKVNVSSRLKGSIRNCLQFGPFLEEKNKDKMIIQIPRYDGWNFTVELDFTNQINNIEIKELIFKTYNFDQTVFKKFDFVSISGDQVVLNFK